MKATKHMKDIIKSGVLGITLIMTLVFSAPFLNDDKEQETAIDSENVELKTEKDIHIPL